MCLPVTTQSWSQSRRKQVWSSPLFPPPCDLWAWDICTALISVSKVPGCFMGKIHLHQRRWEFVWGVWTKRDEGNSPWICAMAEETTSCCLNYRLCEPFSLLTQVIFSRCSETSSLSKGMKQTASSVPPRKCLVIVFAMSIGWWIKCDKNAMLPTFHNLKWIGKENLRRTTDFIHNLRLSTDSVKTFQTVAQSSFTS